MYVPNDFGNCYMYCYSILCLAVAIIKGSRDTQLTAAIPEGFARALLCIHPFIEAREEQQLTSNPASRTAALIVHFAYLWRVYVDILVQIRLYMYIGVHTYARAHVFLSYSCLTCVYMCVSVWKIRLAVFQILNSGVAEDSSWKFMLIGMKSAILRNVGNFTGLHGLTFKNVYLFNL